MEHRELERVRRQQPLAPRFQKRHRPLLVEAQLRDAPNMPCVYACQLVEPRQQPLCCLPQPLPLVPLLVPQRPTLPNAVREVLRAALVACTPQHVVVL